MDPRRVVVSAVALLSVGMAWAPDASATARQLHGGPALGGSWTSGPRGGFDGVAALQGAYDVTDAWRLWANLQYGVGGGDAVNTPRHEVSLSAGVAYVIDVVRALPWIGIGANGTVVIAPGFTGIVPVAEVRGGVDYLVSRYFAVTFQVSYGLVIYPRDSVGDMLSILIGVRWTADL